MYRYVCILNSSENNLLTFHYISFVFPQKGMSTWLKKEISFQRKTKKKKQFLTAAESKRKWQTNLSNWQFHKRILLVTKTEELYTKNTKKKKCLNHLVTIADKHFSLFLLFGPFKNIWTFFLEIMDLRYNFLVFISRFHFLHSFFWRFLILMQFSYCLFNWSSFFSPW